MSIFITFHDIMMSQPDIFQNTATVKLGAVMTAAGPALQGAGAAMSIANQVKGNAQGVQNNQALNYVQQAAQLGSGVAQTANMINNSGQTMKAAKARLTALVTKARSETLLVEMATGVVTPRPGLSPADSAYYAARAVMYNDQIQTVVFQVNAQDIAVKLGLAATALGVVNFVMGIANSGSQSTDPNAAPLPASTPLPTGTLPTGTMPTYTTPPSTNPTSGVNAGTAGSLTGVGSGTPHFGLAGAGQLGAGAMGGAGTQGLGTPGLSPLGSGTSTAGVSSLSGANQPSAVVGTGMAGQSGGSGGSVMGMGGGAMGGAGRDSDRRESNAWRQLTEDEDLWGGDDIPDTNDGVLA